MNALPSLADMAAAARRKNEERENQRQEQLQQELVLAAGFTAAALEDLVAPSSTVEHDTKLSRFNAATAVLQGKSAQAAAPAAPSVAPVQAASVPFDYDSLPEEAQKIIRMVAANPKQYTIEVFGAIKDKDYTKLKKEHQAQQSASQPAAPKPAKAPADSVEEEGGQEKPAEAKRSWADRIKAGADKLMEDNSKRHG
jgi:hypothetical protein